MKSLLAAPVVASLIAGPVWAGGLETTLDQPHDFRDALSSEEDTSVPFSRVADDFVTTTLFQFPTFTFQMVVSFPNIPSTFRFDLFEDDGGRPGDPYLSGLALSPVDLGPWNGRDDLHLIELVSNNADLFFFPNTRYWVSPYADGVGDDQQRALWGTSGNGEINGSEAFFMSESFGAPDWIPVSDDRALGFASDFAFTVEAVVPAPGAFALIGFGLLSTASRRRK